MKKHVLFILLLFITVFASAQMVVSILPPSEFAGNVEFATVSDDGTWSSYPDMENPDNAIIGTLAVGIAEGSVSEDTGLPNDSCACETLTNPEEIVGKIAVVYRGDCNFDQKAANAQAAGAIGVIVVNRLGDDIIGGMACVDLCDVDSLPYVFVQGEQVLNWRPEIDAGELQAFIGNKNGLFDNDIGTVPSQVLRAEFFSQPRALSQNAAEYTVMVAAGIINYGANDQTGVTLNAVITKGGVELYNQTTESPVDITSGDTILFELPDFIQEPFTSGFYEVAYNLNSDVTDEFPSDNELSANFMISDSLFAYSRVDDEGLPRGVSYFRPTGANQGIQSCLAFQDPHASRVIVEGLTFSMATNAESILDEIIDGYAYEWESEFVDVDDLNMDLSNNTISDLTFGSYEYVEELERADIYLPFEEVITLEDDVRYLFCINYFGTDLFSGHDGSVMDYNMNLNTYLQPMFPIADDEAWNVFGFGTDVVPAITVNMKDPLYDAINEQAKRIEITPFPNPTANEINIPVGNNYGQTLIDVYDIAGKKVKSLNITTSSFEIIKVNVSDLDNGAYIFKMNFEDGSFSNFNVVVNN